MSRLLRIPMLLLLPLLLSACVLLPVEGGGGAENDESRVAAGLREALRVGTERTVDRTNREGGYLQNAQIRIPLPEDVQSAGSQLRRIGLGRQVDELETAMNRAAEQAAGEAAQVFSQAIRSMQPADVYAVFRGGSDAATQYLRQESESVLRDRYQPVVATQLASVNGYDYFQEIARTWNRLPLVSPIEVDLERYVTERALDGLFTVLAEEEQRIREDPVARTTSLLRDVFGRSDG